MGEGKQILHALRLGCFAEKLYFCEVNPTETMKKFLILLYATTCLSATAAAQARFTSNTARHSLGQIEWKHPVTADFLVTNTGNQPLVLSDAEPDCACAVAQWTQTPIAPGATGTVSVTFDAEALGHFQKSIAVFTNAEPHVVYLYLDGEVVGFHSSATGTAHAALMAAREAFTEAGLLTPLMPLDADGAIRMYLLPRS